MSSSPSVTVPLPLRRLSTVSARAAALVFYPLTHSLSELPSHAVIIQRACFVRAARVASSMGCLPRPSPSVGHSS